MDEWKLLADWRKGDASAGSLLVEAHFPAISRFFRNKLGDDIDDVIQQTFLACVEGRDRIDGSFRSYLYGIASRRLFDHLRLKYKDKRLDFALSSLADLGTTPSEGIAKNQRAQFLQMALLHLPLESQLLLELSYWEELSGQEIAVALKIKEGTVRSRLSRARERLREIVAGLGGDVSGLFGQDSQPVSS